MRTKCNLWTTNTVAKAWIEGGLVECKDIKVLRESITNKFKYILKKKLGFNKDEVAWFKSGRGFVFADKESPELILNLFNLFEKKNVMLTIVEEHILIYTLKRLLGIEISMCCIDKRTVRIKEAVEHVNNSVWNIGKTEKSEGKEKLGGKEKPKEKEELEENIMLKKRISQFFREKFFVKVSTKQVSKNKARHIFYIYFCKLIKNWQKKYCIAMNKYNEDEVSDLCSPYLNKGKLNAAECCELCEELVYFVVKPSSIDNDDKIIREALAELAKICKFILLYKNIMCIKFLSKDKKDEIMKSSNLGWYIKKNMYILNSKEEYINEYSVTIFDFLLNDRLAEI